MTEPLRQTENRDQAGRERSDAFTRELLGEIPDIPSPVAAVPPALLLPTPAPAVLRASIASLFALLALFSYTFGYIATESPRRTLVIAPGETGRPAQPNPFENIAIKGRAAYVYDIHGERVLFARNEFETLPLASLTKLMTAVVSAEELPPHAEVTIRPEDLAREGDAGLFSHERWRLSDIIGFMLLTSSNDAASALAYAAGNSVLAGIRQETTSGISPFLARMNERTGELGLRGTFFFNETGLDVDSEISGGYGTARDVAILMKQALAASYPAIETTSLSRTELRSLDGIRHHATNTNEEIHRIPAIIASKTGYTDLAGGNLAVVFDAGLMRPVVVVILGSTQEGRFRDVETLAWAALEAIRAQ